MKQSPAVIFFTKGDSDDGGVNSIEIILNKVLSANRVVMTNCESYRAKKGEVVYRFQPFVNLRPGNSLEFVGKLKLIPRLLWANVESYRILSKHKSKTIICNDFWSFWHVFLSCLLLRIEILLYVRDTPSNGREFSRAWILPFILASKVLCLSRELRLRVVSSRCVRIFRGERFFQRFVVVPSVVDMLSPDLIKRDGDLFTIGYVASFRKKKRQLEFVRNVIAPLSTKLNHFKVVFLGGVSSEDLDYRQTCLDEVVRLGLSEYVEFVDHADDPTEFFSKFHISCLVSSNEGLARVMLESLACATPVISFDVCSAKEVLQKNNCGIVVEMDNYNAFCNEIVQLSGDREKLLEMANNARDCIAKNYNAELVRQKMGELF